MATPNLGLAQPPDGNTNWGNDIRGNFDILDAAVFSHHFAQGVHSGLNFAHKGGVYRNASGVTVVVAGGSIALTDDATNYVEIDVAGGTVSANTTGFTAGNIPLYEVVTASGSISTVTDRRAFLVPVVSGSGGGGIPDVLTTKGDLLVFDGAQYLRIGVGNDGQILVADARTGCGLRWDTPADGGWHYISPVIRASVTDAVLDGARGVAVQGNYAYIGAGSADALVVVDVSNPASPVVVGSVTDAALVRAWGVAVCGGYVYVAAYTANRLDRGRCKQS